MLVTLSTKDSAGFCLEIDEGAAFFYARIVAEKLPGIDGK